MLEALKSRDYRTELLIKVILLFLFLMFKDTFLNILPNNISTILSKVFKNSTISIMVILLVINWAITPTFLNNFKKGITNKYFIISFCYWFLHVIGLFYSSNSKEAGFIVEKKLSLLIFPLIFATIQLNEDSKLRIYKWFSSLVIIVSILCLLFGIINYFTTHNIKSITLENTLFIDIHRVVMSMYLTIGLYFCFELYKSNIIKLNQILIYIIIATIHVFLMASRLYMAVYLLLLFFLLFKYITNKKALWKISSVGFGIMSLLIFILYSKNELFRSQINTIWSSKQNSKATTNGVSERAFQRDAALNLISRNPILGIGPGDVTDSLVNEYKKMNWQIGVEHKYHAHNQYLQSFIALGILGVILLIATFFYPFIFYNSTGTEAKICSILFGVSLLTDNHTELQQSIIFMFLWLSMFINLPKSSLNK